MIIFLVYITGAKYKKTPKEKNTKAKMYIIKNETLIIILAFSRRINEIRYKIKKMLIIYKNKTNKRFLCIKSHFKLSVMK
jgi:penicillin V acylase-like amidase (Ntn superfamily)